MTAQLGLWPYPIIGAVAVMDSGARIEVWPDEGCDPDCFAGSLLDPNKIDVSVFWDRAEIVSLEIL